jgi:hypothetical protein
MNCKLEGMKLISIETKEEQDAITEELSSSLNFTDKKGFNIKFFKRLF